MLSESMQDISNNLQLVTSVHSVYLKNKSKTYPYVQEV